MLCKDPFEFCLEEDDVEVLAKIMELKEIDSYNLLERSVLSIIYGGSKLYISGVCDNNMVMSVGVVISIEYQILYLVNIV